MKKWIVFVLMSVLAFPAFAGCEGSSDVRVYIPDGAGALALAKLMATAPEIEGRRVKYTVMTASAIGQRVAGDEPEIALMPFNAAAKLYNTTGEYLLLSVNTHGNLYVVGEEAMELEDLKGKRLGVIGQGQVPDLVMRQVLKAGGIPYEPGDTKKEGRVTLRYAADGASALALLAAGAIDCALLGEPAATNAIERLGKTTALDVQSLFEPLCGRYGFPQAALTVKKTFAQSNPAFIKAVSDILKDDDWVIDHIEEALATLAEHMEKGVVSTVGTLSAAVAARCNIKFVSAAEIKDAAQTFVDLVGTLDEEFHMTLIGPRPADAFYYTAP